MIVVKDGVKKRRAKVNSNDSYQEVGAQFVSEKMIFWKRYVGEDGILEDNYVGG